MATAEAEEENIRPTDQSFRENLPVVEISEEHCKKLEDGTMEKPSCHICITDFEMKEKAVLLPCGHMYH